MDLSENISTIVFRTWSSKSWQATNLIQQDICIFISRIHALIVTMISACARYFFPALSFNRFTDLEVSLWSHHNTNDCIHI